MSDESNTTKPETYEIGYGKPPQGSRFKPGQSGNPKGRKKGSKSLKSILLKAASKKIRVKTKTGVRSMTQNEALVETTIQQALQGDAKARTEYFKLMKSTGLMDQLSDDVDDTMKRLSEEDEQILSNYPPKTSGDTKK